MISASSFFPCPSPCFPADHREQATPSPSKCTTTQRQNAFHHIMDRLEQLCCCFLPPGKGEGEGTKHASGLDSPGGISIDMGQPSATRDIYCTPRCRTKHCILLTVPRPCRHLPAHSLSPALPCSWQPGLTKTWKSPNDIIWSFKEKKSGEEPIKKFIFTLVLAAALGNGSSRIPKLCSAVLERRKQNTRPMRSD